jgi:predicted O-methyltransferase YrrM
VTVVEWRPRLPSIDSSVSSEEAYRLRDLARGARVLELGSWRGFSTVVMAQVALMVHAVDHHLGDEHAGFDESLTYLIEALDVYDVRRRVVVHVGSSEDVLPMLPEGRFDLAFIDAFHEAAAVRRDLALVRRLVKVDGIIAFHDYGRFDVAEVVDETATEGWLEFVELVETLAVTRRTA